MVRKLPRKCFALNSSIWFHHIKQLSKLHQALVEVYFESKTLLNNKKKTHQVEEKSRKSKMGAITNMGEFITHRIWDGIYLHLADLAIIADLNPNKQCHCQWPSQLR